MQSSVNPPTRDEMTLVFALARHACLGDENALRVIDRVSTYYQAIWRLAEQRKAENLANQVPRPSPPAKRTKSKTLAPPD
jgi:hypothetical protein